MLSGTVSRGRKPYCSPATVRLYAWWRWRKEEIEVAVGSGGGKGGEGGERFFVFLFETTLVHLRLLISSNSLSAAEREFVFLREKPDVAKEETGLPPRLRCSNFFPPSGRGSYAAVDCRGKLVKNDFLGKLHRYASTRTTI